MLEYDRKSCFNVFFYRGNFMDNVLLSVGIDIGTSTTQLVFSKLYIENTASAWTVPTVQITGKEIIYQSNIHFTPLKSETVIDAYRVREKILDEYRCAGIVPENVDTGAVIITGETARKENAADVLNMLSGLAGDFVVATAGPDLEGVLAGKGSGAWEYSKKHSQTVMNFDIGGGTTNVAVYKNGDVVDSACFDIGGRLIKVDTAGKITYISEKVNALCQEIGVTLQRGEILLPSQAMWVTEAMAKAIIAIATHDKDHPLYQLLITNHGISFDGPIDTIFLSGGVADCMGHKTDQDFLYGDIGILLGKSIQHQLEKNSLVVEQARETIRATVVGAGSHTTDVSGSTITFDDTALPIKNIPIIRLSTDEEEKAGEKRITAIARRLEWFRGESLETLVALSLAGSRDLGFDQMQALAHDIVEGMAALLNEGLPLIVLLDYDLAKALGHSLKRQLLPEQSVICIDSVSVDNGDYIDLGRPIAGGQVIPVIIKTLLFGY